MKILKEITEWKDMDFQPNHTYHVNDAGKMIAFQPDGGELIRFSAPRMFDRKGRKFLTLASRPDEVVVKGNEKTVQGSNGSVYIIADGKCSCPGFKFRGKCKHLEKV